MVRTTPERRLDVVHNSTIIMGYVESLRRDIACYAPRVVPLQSTVGLLAFGAPCLTPRPAPTEIVHAAVEASQQSDGVGTVWIGE